MGGGMIFFSARTQKLVDFDLPTTTTLKAPVIHTDNPFSILHKSNSLPFKCIN